MMRNARIGFAIGALVLGAAHAWPLPWAGAAENDTAAAASAATKPDWQPPRTDDGWLDLKALLVPSDGSRIPGSRRREDPRDRGSKLVFFDPDHGDNATGEVYWWDGKRIVDSSKSDCLASFSIPYHQKSSVRALVRLGCR